MHHLRLKIAAIGVGVILAAGACTKSKKNNKQAATDLATVTIKASEANLYRDLKISVTNKTEGESGIQSNGAMVKSISDQAMADGSFSLGLKVGQRFLINLQAVQQSDGKPVSTADCGSWDEAVVINGDNVFTVKLCANPHAAQENEPKVAPSQKGAPANDLVQAGIDRFGYHADNRTLRFVFTITRDAVAASNHKGVCCTIKARIPIKKGEEHEFVERSIDPLILPMGESSVQSASIEIQLADGSTIGEANRLEIEKSCYERP